MMRLSNPSWGAAMAAESSKGCSFSHSREAWRILAIISAVSSDGRLTFLHL